MPRSFIVVIKTVSVMADFNNGFVELDKLSRSRRLSAIKRARRARSTWPENRIEGILSKDVFDVGDEQLLMLLLMMKAERQDRLDLAKKFFVGTGDEFIDVGIDRRAVFLCFFNSRPRNQPAQIASMHCAGGIVVRIKEIRIFRNGV